MKVFRNVLRQHVAYFDDPKHSTGKIGTRLATDAPNVKAVSLNHSVFWNPVQPVCLSVWEYYLGAWLSSHPGVIHPYRHGGRLSSSSRVGVANGTSWFGSTASSCECGLCHGENEGWKPTGRGATHGRCWQGRHIIVSRLSLVEPTHIMKALQRVIHKVRNRKVMRVHDYIKPQSW